MKERNLNVEFKLEGNWWLPETPNKKVHGSLTFDPEDGLVLRFFGHIGEDPAPGVVFIDYHQIIHGETTEHEDVTLYRCNMDEHNAGPLGENSFKPIFMLGGILCNSGELMKFDAITLTFPGLESWLGESPFSRARDEGYQVIKYKDVEHFQFDLPSVGASISSRNWMTLGSSVASGWEESIEANPFLKFQFKNAMSIDEFYRLIIQIENLFTLMLRQPIASRKIFLWDATLAEEKAVDEQGRPIQRKAELVFPQRGFEKERRLRRHDILVKKAHIPTDALSSLFDIWFGNYDKMSPAYSLFFAGVYKPDLYVEFQFLALAQAVESFHRITQGGTFVDDKEYDEFAKAIRAAMPVGTSSDLKQSFEEKIKYGNEVTLRRRIRELINGLPKELRPFFPDNEREMVLAIVRLRNDLTHPDDKTPSLNISKISRGSQILKVLLTIHLLLELKLPARQIHKAIDDAYGWILRRIKDADGFSAIWEAPEF